MKRAIGAVAAVVAVLLVAQVCAAAGTTKVSGDVARDGYLMVDVNWTIDTAQYPGESSASIREKVAADVWKQVLPQIVQKTSGITISYDRSAFIPLSTTTTLVEQRADGTRVYSKHCLVRFNCVRDDARAVVEGTKERTKKMDSEFHYRFVREGID